MKSTQSVEKTVLANGLRVITERMPDVRSIAVGVWVDSGSRHENASESGISHFVEHMVFKGTETRTAEDIACTIDAIGGYLDAYTSKETVAFTAKVLDEHLPRALDVLSDLTLHPAFREEDITKERGVVLEELKMDEDNPDYLIHDLFARGFWKDHSLARPIIGNRETITAFQREQLLSFFQRTYHPSNLMITAAGNLRHEDLVKEVEKRFRELQKGNSQNHDVAPKTSPEIVLRDKPSLEQAHVCLGLPACSMADPRRYPAFVLHTLLGGGFSSRLFLKIREREGLAYSVYSDLSFYQDAGCLSVYAGTSREMLDRVIEYVLHEFRDLKKNLVPDEELRRAKDHLKGSLMLSLEATANRMSHLARQERYFGRFMSLDEISQRVEDVTAQDVRDVANDWFHGDRIAVAVLGPLNGYQIGRKSLIC